jgi:hypothetical protein
MAKNKKNNSNKVNNKKRVATKKLSTPKDNTAMTKNLIAFFYYLLMPSILVSLTTRVFSFNRVWIASIYLITLISIIVFFLFKFHHHKSKILALLLGLAISPVYTYIYEARWAALARDILGDDFLILPFFYSSFSFFFYVLPTLILSALILIVILTFKARANIEL